MQRQRQATLGDKVGGAITKLRGSLTNRPAVKVSSSPVILVFFLEPILITLCRLLGKDKCTVTVDGESIECYNCIGIGSCTIGSHKRYPKEQKDELELVYLLLATS